MGIFMDGGLGFDSGAGKTKVCSEARTWGADG